MNDFDLWYAYFDSLFLKTQPLPHISFVNTLSINAHIRRPFNQCKKLPEISRCFQEFQKFLFNEQTWIECECDHLALKEIEANVNLVALLINIEKKYGQDFWHLKRRIQTSICHFFALLLFFLASLFPTNDPTQTLQKLKSTNRLCTSIKALEQFVNKILPQMNPIIQFLYQQSFSEEKKLTILFLQQIKQALLNLPKLGKKKFKHQFELSKYLFVIIPIELSKSQYKFKVKRKKAITISNNLEMKYYSDEVLSKSTRQQIDLGVQNLLKRLSLPKLNQNVNNSTFRTKIIKRKKTMEEEVLDEQFPIDNNPTYQRSLPKVFEFSQKLRKYSFYLAQKKFTKATFQTRQTMELKPFSVQKQRKKSDFAKTSNSRSKEKQFGRTYSIEKHRHMTSETIRSKKSSFHKVHRKTIIQQSQKHRHHKERSLAKQNRQRNIPTVQIINKPQYEISPLLIPSKKVNICTGETRGWGMIQEQVNMSIVTKKIHLLIHSHNSN